MHPQQGPCLASNMSKAALLLTLGQDTLLGVCRAHVAAWCCGRRCRHHPGGTLFKPLNSDKTWADAALMSMTLTWQVQTGGHAQVRSATVPLKVILESQYRPSQGNYVIEVCAC